MKEQMESHFQRFGSATVEFTGRSGTVFRVQMLPVHRIDNLARLRRELFHSPGADRMTALRRELREIILTVWPKAHKRELLRFDCAGLLEI